MTLYRFHSYVLVFFAIGGIIELANTPGLQSFANVALGLLLAEASRRIFKQK
jgi:hypothetical protein